MSEALVTLAKAKAGRRRERRNAVSSSRGREIQVSGKEPARTALRSSMSARKQTMPRHQQSLCSYGLGCHLALCLSCLKGRASPPVADDVASFFRLGRQGDLSRAAAVGPLELGLAPCGPTSLVTTTTARRREGLRIHGQWFARVH